MTETNPIYIYALVCPIIGKIRYIGKSVNPYHRLYRHLATARTGYYDHYTARWIRTLLRDNLEPQMEVLCRVPDGEPWQEYERQYIAKALAEGLPLTNGSAGGEGVTFLSDDDFLRAKRSRKDGMTREVKARMGNSQKAAWADPEIRSRRIEGLKKTAMLPDSRQRLRKAARSRTPEGELRRIAAVRARYRRNGPAIIDIAIKAGVGRESVRKFFRGDHLSDSIFQKIASAVGTTIKSIQLPLFPDLTNK